MNEEDNNQELNNEQENLPQEEESKKSENEKNIDKKIQEQLSKSATKNAAQKSLIKFLLPILTWVLVFIIILIIIIGIVMFFLTMPGMVIEQIKQLARNVGEAVASWFGEDETKQISDEDINEVLDYLEQMGYDLKGYGFLTDTVGSNEDGVERTDEGKIKEAKSDFIRNYLISDNYVYTIKNFNMTSSGWFTGILEHIASFFTGGQSNRYWSRGMIEIWKDTGEIGVKDEANGYYNVYEPGAIEIDVARKTMEISKGWFNNSVTYNLDGWTGRYGMPIDFLLSVHVATMMPDLSYDMATSFETLIEILLHYVGGGPKDSNTAVSYFKTASGNYVSYDDFEKLASEGFFGGLGGWYINKEEAMKIMKTYGIKSPDDCIGVSDVGEDDIHNYQNSVSLDSDKIVEQYSTMIQKFKEYGATDTDLQNAGLSSSISSIEDFKSMLEEIEEKESTSDTTYTYYEPSKEKSFIVKWQAQEGDSEYQLYTAEISLKYDNYHSTTRGYQRYGIINRLQTRRIYI